MKKIALLGFGKIAKDQHVAAIAATKGVELAAIVSAHSRGIDGVPHFASLDDLIASGEHFDAISHCNTPEARFETVLKALDAGYDCLLEKPPVASLSQANILINKAAETGRLLMTSWHSRHNEAVKKAKEILAQRDVVSFVVDWRENVRKWHPGQEWIWHPSGFGVFDPGINGLSVATAALSQPIYVTSANVHVPQNRHAPIAAHLHFAGVGGLVGEAIFDWREVGGEIWQVRFETKQGPVVLDGGGRRLIVDGQEIMAHGDGEYADIYADFAAALESRQSNISLAPLRLVADAMLLARHDVCEPFED